MIVTGSARGIGRAIAEEMGRGGAKVVVNYSKSKGPAEDLVAQLRETGSLQAVAIQADVSDAAQAARLIEETCSQFGRIDVLVNNAGIPSTGLSCASIVFLGAASLVVLTTLLVLPCPCVLL